jgi:hypothetical protein
MKTPTLEEVKEYFKNAKVVRSVFKNLACEVNTKDIFREYDGTYYYEDDLNYIYLWTKDKGFAGIISFKQEPKPLEGFLEIAKDFQVKDPIVESVVKQFQERSEVGIKKYGTTLDRNDLTTLEWINHAQQEAMDFCLYLEKLKQEYGKK